MPHERLAFEETETAARRSGPPASVTNGWINSLGLVAFLAFVGFGLGYLPPEDQAVAAVLVLALPIAGLELLLLKVHRRTTTGLAWEARRPFAAGRVLRKYLGLAATLGAMAALYWVLPEYATRFYQPFWHTVGRYGPWLLPVTLVYIALLDRRMAEPEDAYARIGAFLLGGGAPDRVMLAEHARAWTIKGFFLPLMFCYLVGTLQAVDRSLAGLEAGRFLSLYDVSWQLLFAIDLIFTTTGYLLTLRLLDAQIRSSEPTLFGWMVAIMCYQPFWSFVSRTYLPYEEGFTWGPWLCDLPLLQMAWGTAILALLAIYAAATVCFGCRFSNLTHRGILTNGPYRWGKHPAYLSKNLLWWLVAVPFVTTGTPEEALRNCLLLLGVNLVYLFRAWTEERHLSRDPTYRAYAAWIAEHGLFARLGRRLRSLHLLPGSLGSRRP